MNSNDSPFYRDLDLRGLAKTSKDTIIGAKRRYEVWCATVGADPSKGDHDDLAEYLRFLRGKGYRKAYLSRTFSSLATWFDYLKEQGKIAKNPARYVQKKYLHQYKPDSQTKQIISVEQAANMVRATIDSRDKAILLLFLKTGIRRNELISLNVDDIDLPNLTLTLHPTAKRSNRKLYFDQETATALIRWIRSRETRCRGHPEAQNQLALFIGPSGERLGRSGVTDLVVAAAERVGLHDPSSERLEDRFGPHNCRHWFTTHLIRAGMPRDYIKELRGDSKREAIDVYNHIDPKELEDSYMEHMPRLGV